MEWRRLRRGLEQQGADEPALAAIEDQIVAAPHVVGPPGTRADDGVGAILRY